MSQFEPTDAYSSNADKLSEDELASSDEEKSPDDMSCDKHMIIILFLCLMILCPFRCHCGNRKMMPTKGICCCSIGV